MKRLPERTKARIAQEIKMLLHASRDCMRNQKQDTKTVPFHAWDPYYSEAFGMLRTLVILNYGKFGAVNIPDNFNSWFYDLSNEVLKEEGFEGNNMCDHCFEKYGKDDTRNKYK